ncbi:creatininase family protein [Haloimpatiens massiliensis]|uniref:creatininase family protein n=1 Tax=Haloimpatiens massiliensis TaxID=1658110 RepID=UPI000C81E237|nr:creatininase family protein [Haloimpatiens massiliensis]
MSIKKMEEMTWKEFERLDKDKTVVIVGLSPIEEHGPHLPLGTDFIAANDCLSEVVKYLEKRNSKFNYILHPPFPIGYNESIINFPGTMFYRTITIENLLIDFGASISRSGINKMVIINHHLDLGHIKAIENAREHLLDKFNIKLLEVASRMIYSDENHKDSIQKEEDNQREIHADIRETSFMLYKHPQLVKDCYKDLEPVYLDMKKFIMSGEKCFRENGIIEGYIGSPGNATFEYGEKQFQDMITQTGTLILKFLKGEAIPEISSVIKAAMNHIEWR